MDHNIMDTNSIIEARIALDKDKLTRTAFNTMLRKILKEQFPHFDWAVSGGNKSQNGNWGCYGLIWIKGNRKSKEYSTVANKEVYKATNMFKELEKVKTKNSPYIISFDCE